MNDLAIWIDEFILTGDLRCVEGDGSAREGGAQRAAAPAAARAAPATHACLLK